MIGLLHWHVCRVALVLAFSFYAANAVGYSVLTHEELIDLAWNDSIRPFLLARFPNATEEQLKEAPCLCRRRLRHPGHGLLPLRESIFQQPDALRPHRRFHRLAVSSCPHDR